MPIQTHIAPGDIQEHLSKARERYRFGLAVDKEDRTLAQDDVLFAAALPVDGGGSTQWFPEAIQQRLNTKRPCITWNRLPTYIQQVVNAGRETRPSIKTTPMDGGTQETSEYLQGRIRHIEYESNADTARDAARSQQVTSGRGFLRVTTEYIKGKMSQRICIDPIDDQFSIVWDPGGKKYDRTDADWCFVVSYITKQQHVDRFGEDSVVSRIDFTSFDTTNNPAPDWIGVGKDGELIQIADYYFKKRKSVKVYLLSDGREGTFEQLPEGVNVIDLRDEDVVMVWYQTINGAEILDETQWLDETIPIVPYWGREEVVGGKKYTISLIRDAKSPQRQVNLMVSTITELIGQIPKSPVMVPVGGIPDNMTAQWANVHTDPRGFLLFNAIDPVTGNPLPAPFRIANEPPIQACTIALEQAIDGIKASMGIFDASLGKRREADQSGVAIQREQMRADVGNFHFPDNEARSNKCLGEILLRLIKKLDKPGTLQPIRSVDGKTEQVPIGAPYVDPKTGKKVFHDLGAGDYLVAIETGPSYTSQLQEMNERDAEIIKAAPELLDVFGDLYFASDSTPGSQERAERMKEYIKIKVPGLIKDDPKDAPPIPPQAMQQIQSLSTMLQHTEALATELQRQIETKEPEIQKDLKLKEMDLTFQREKLGVDSNVKLTVAGLQTDMEQLKHEIAVLMQAVGLASSADQAEADRQHQMTMGAQGHSQALEQNEQQAELAPEPAGATT